MKKPLLEALSLLAILLGALKIAQLFSPPSWTATLAPILLLYLPLAVYLFTKRPIDFIDRNWFSFLKGVGAFLLTILLVFPPYIAVAHYWMLHVFNYQGFSAAPASVFFGSAFYQVLLVALPEEFFFRGYFQSTLNRAFEKKWVFFNFRFGWGFILTALIFAFAHSVIYLKWWHFSIFFPALLFGFLRERTGSITAPVLFHAFCNSFTSWFMQSYIS